MDFEISINIVNNAALLLALSIVYALIPTNKSKVSLHYNFIVGSIIGMVGIVIMFYPFPLAPGIVLDVRSILISVTGLFFGLIPTIIAVVMTSLFRIFQGGDGAITGVCVITLSAIIGLLFRHYRFEKLCKNKKLRWLELYLLGIVTHIGMLVCFFLLPYATALTLLEKISIPVMIIYPIGTVLLGLILLKQIDNKKVYILLNESKKQLERAVDGSPVPIMLHAEDGEVIKISDTWTKLTGYTHNDIPTTKKWSEKAYGTLKDEVNSVINSLYYLKEQLHDGEYPVTTKDGRSLVWDFYSSYIGNLSDGRRMAMSVAIDITHQKSLEKEKNNLDNKLKQQQRLESIGTLAGGVAHEINNPINGIMNYAQIIKDDVKADEIAEYADEIIHETKRVAFIVKNLLNFSRQEKQTFSKVKIKDVFDQTSSLISSIIKHDQIDLQISIPDNLPDIMCRYQQIQQVIINLLTNARDSLNKKYPDYNENKKINIICSSIKKNKKPFIRITIIDHGNGIPKAVQEKIFDPFFTTKGRSEGTGLGLAISYGIIEDHKGDITFETKEGEYTKFYVDLPLDIN